MSKPNEVSKRAAAIDTDDEVATAVGCQLARVLGLKPQQFGRYKIASGLKRPQGLARTVLRVLLKGVEE